MTTILLSIGIIAAFAILFWLDKKQGPEPTPAIVHVFDVLRNLNWDMNENEIKNTFQGSKKGTSTRLNKKSILTRKENFGGQEIYTTFSFPNDNAGRVSKAEIRLSRISQKDIDQLFRTVCKQYGQPGQHDSNIEGSVKWATEPGILTLENTAPEEYTLTIKEEDIKV
ncbi:MAG: hypothetical protein DHS20C13_19790 [Thermodesulfobacteriota bacterium]|nr:MAG: hypothetical protein DHS20C13_19790 [Thermodesulfobacteriota bacterium]